MTRGVCTTCGKLLGKSSMTSHLQTHFATGTVTQFHLLVDSGSEFWMHLQARHDTTLADLDMFLRDEWLECCDHMSQFKIGGKAYTSHPEHGEGGMDVALTDVLAEEFVYEYDFGSTTTLRLRVVGTWQGAPGRSPVTLLARNEPPARPCVECGRPGEVVCVACCDGPNGTVLCGECAGGHGCDEDHRLPVVNSPRCGVCGYTGDAW